MSVLVVTEPINFIYQKTDASHIVPDFASLHLKNRNLAKERLKEKEANKSTKLEDAIQVVGIDLGTTNSCVAVIASSQPAIILNAEGSRTTPSVVALTKQGEWLVGEAARQQAVTDPENTIFSIKRFLGRNFEDPEVERDRLLVPYKIVRTNEGEAWVEIQGKEYSPIEISAKILQKLKADAETCIDKRITYAVITVPSYFNEKQRKAVKASGEIAGFEVLRIINEPTVASLA